MSETGFEHLVDPRFGPITRLTRQPLPPGLPAGFTAYSAQLADTRAFAPWRAGPYAFGASLTDPGQARAAAVGEAVERYCGNAVPPDLPRATYRDWVGAGAEALDPATLVLYSEQQYRRPGFPFQRFGPHLPVCWVQGRDLATGAPVLVPASMVYLNYYYYYYGRYADEPRTNFTIMPGIAAGPDIGAAVRAACAELIERDAVTVWWQRGQAVTAVQPGSDGFPDTVLATADAHPPPTYHLFRVPSDLGVPVLAALLDDSVAGVVTMGAACHPKPRVAATKALTEAVQFRALSLDLLDPDSRVWRGIRAGVRDGRIVRPYRADRAYRDAGRADFADIVDFAAHVQLYLDPRMRVHLTRILHPARHEPLPDEDGPDPVDLLTSQGWRVVVVDLTTPEVADTGWCVVRVVVPGLYPNAPAAYPFLGGHRLYRSPDRPEPLTTADLVQAPSPAV